MTIQFGFIDQGDGANLRTLPAEMKGSTCLTPAPLPPGTRVSVIRDHAQAPGWSYVSTVAGGYLLQGYVQTLRITTQLPEPAATLYQVRPGDRPGAHRRAHLPAGHPAGAGPALLRECHSIT